MMRTVVLHCNKNLYEGYGLRLRLLKSQSFFIQNIFLGFVG